MITKARRLVRYSSKTRKSIAKLENNTSSYRRLDSSWPEPLYVYKCIQTYTNSFQNTLRIILKNYFFPTEETPIRTRSSFQKLKIPRRKTNIELKSLSYTGPSLWNNLNKNLKRSSSINDFKHKIKSFISKN